ncbi:MAG: hypothetical protein U1E05_18930 [Patescibacteria group bacterium]|nr:hypothetical protein [Patescibacteria group bacterium]
MSRNRKQGQNRGTASESPAPAALASQVAGLPVRGGGPVGRPAWAPGEVDLFKVPESVRQAVAEIIEPAYRQLVATVEDPLERSIGLTLVHMMWLEVLDQHETKHEYLATSILELPADRSDMIDRHLRMLNMKVKVGSFLIRLREMRRQSEAAAPQKVSGVRDQVSVTCSRGGEESELGDRRWGEEVSGVSCQVSETGTRPAGEAEGECGKDESCHPKKQVSVTRSRGTKSRSWEIEDRSWGEEASVTPTRPGGEASEMGDRRSEMGEEASVTPTRPGVKWMMNVEKEKAATQKNRCQVSGDRDQVSGVSDALARGRGSC